MAAAASPSAGQAVRIANGKVMLHCKRPSHRLFQPASIMLTDLIPS